MAQFYRTETFSFYPEDKAMILDVSRRLGMKKSTFMRLAVKILDGHVRAVQRDVSRSLKPGEDFQEVFQRRILSDFDYLISGQGKIGKPKKSLEELKKQQLDLF